MSWESERPSAAQVIALVPPARRGDVRTVHTVASLRAEHGGPSRSVTALCSAQNLAGVDVRIVTTQSTTEGPPVLPDPHVPVQFTARPGPLDVLPLKHPEFMRALGREGELDVLHDHGLWLSTNHLAARFSRHHRVPRVVSVRGMLSAWALAQGRTKKRIAWSLYQRRDLRTAALLHGTADAEAEDIRRMGLTGPVAVLPNGVVIPPWEASPPPETGRVIHRALFLARLHPGKGLLDLVQAWARVRPEQWELVVAGPDDGGHQKEVEAAARELGVLGSIRFIGEVADAAKWDLYRSADLFILPTHSENFGITVAEALAAGVPVLTTRGAPWSDLETHRCGWWVDIGPAGLERGLREALSVSDEERRGRGQRGRALVEAQYSWESVAQRMLEAYAWILGRGARPGFVHER
jgi:glycosyltransferase involved in cell wall biosynthesis